MNPILKKSPLIRARKNVEVQDTLDHFESNHASEITTDELSLKGSEKIKVSPMRRTLSSPELVSLSISNSHTPDALNLSYLPTVRFNQTSIQTKHINPSNPHTPSLSVQGTPIHETEDRTTIVVSGQRARFKSDLELYTHSTHQGYDDDDDDFMDGLSEEDEDEDEHRKKSFRRSSAAYIVQENISSHRRGKRSIFGGCCWCNFLSLEKPNWNRVSSFVVRNAPCFWCCGERIETSITNRMIVMRLNTLCLIFALFQVASGFFLFYLTCLTNPTRRDILVENRTKYWREALIPNLWTPSGSITLLAVVGLALFITILLSRRSIKQFNLTGSMRYLWTLYWLIPLEIFLVISLVDYHKVTEVWVHFWWPTASLAWFRQIFCYGNTADTICRAKCYPDVRSCGKIRSDAMRLMIRSSYVFFYSNAAVGFVLILLVSFSSFHPHKVFHSSAHSFFSFYNSDTLLAYLDFVHVGEINYSPNSTKIKGKERSTLAYSSNYRLSRSG